MASLLSSIFGWLCWLCPYVQGCVPLLISPWQLHPLHMGLAQEKMLQVRWGVCGQHLGWLQQPTWGPRDLPRLQHWRSKHEWLHLARLWFHMAHTAATHTAPLFSACFFLIARFPLSKFGSVLQINSVENQIMCSGCVLWHLRSL